jgi:Na+-transporting methylmalonyl-CoA/oxaloacetate decarboxylase gamma subunit
MSESITIFISGLTGVFVGMGLLWFFTTMTSIIADRLNKDKEEAK